MEMPVIAHTLDPRGPARRNHAIHLPQATVPAQNPERVPAGNFNSFVRTPHKENMGRPTDRRKTDLRQ
jgi:hypothetical protein